MNVSCNRYLRMRNVHQRVNYERMTKVPEISSNIPLIYEKPREIAKSLKWSMSWAFHVYRRIKFRVGKKNTGYHFIANRKSCDIGTLFLNNTSISWKLTLVFIPSLGTVYQTILRLFRPVIYVDPVWELNERGDPSLHWETVTSSLQSGFCKHPCSLKIASKFYHKSVESIYNSATPCNRGHYSTCRFNSHDCSFVVAGKANGGVLLWRIDSQQKGSDRVKHRLSGINHVKCSDV